MSAFDCNLCNKTIIIIFIVIIINYYYYYYYYYYDIQSKHLHLSYPGKLGNVKIA